MRGRHGSRSARLRVVPFSLRERLSRQLHSLLRAFFRRLEHALELLLASSQIEPQITIVQGAASSTAISASGVECIAAAICCRMVVQVLVKIIARARAAVPIDVSFVVDVERTCTGKQDQVVSIR